MGLLQATAYMLTRKLRFNTPKNPGEVPVTKNVPMKELHKTESEKPLKENQDSNTNSKEIKCWIVLNRLPYSFKVETKVVFFYYV